MADLAAVARFAADFAARVPKLRAVVHDAGTMVPERRETSDGHELTLATHVLGPHLLTRGLVDVLDASGDGRLVWVSSGGMYASELRDDDLEFLKSKYSGEVAYARTKRMQLVLAELWAEHLVDRHVVVARDAPRLGRHPRRTHVPAQVPWPDSAFHALGERGRRHAYLVGRIADAESQHRPVLERPPRATTTYGRRGRESADRRHRFWAFCQAVTNQASGANTG